MLKFIFGFVAGTSSILAVLFLLIGFSTIRFNTCYLTKSNQKIAFGGALWMQGSWFPLGNTNSYDMIILGKLKPCPVEAKENLR